VPQPRQGRELAVVLRQGDEVDDVVGQTASSSLIRTTSSTFVAPAAYDGELGILPGRAPLIGRLGYGELRTRTGGATRHYFVDGGFAQVRDDVVTVLTGRAIPAERIDAGAAADELERARTRRTTTDGERAEKERAIARARAQLRVAAHRG
jgi:F-type H+-transporting ATPase subunit epsilon